VRLRARLASPALIIDVKGVEELSLLEHQGDGGLRIGAAVVMNRVADDARLRPVMTALTEGAAAVGTYAIRNRATVAGNVANASPCADTVPPLAVLGAEIELRSRTGTRRLALADFVLGNRVTARRPDEYVAAVHVPPQTPGTRTLFLKRRRLRGHDLALVSAAVMHDPERKRLRVAVGSCSPAPIVLRLDDLLPSMEPEEAARRAMAAIAPISDVRASAEYRNDMTGVLVRRLLGELRA
jgi:carbon-monoxide dehydrogenase medium subunit